jgi:hypothetical protein
MSINCPHCGSDLTAPQSVRIAEYHFGRLESLQQDPLEGPGFRYHFEQPDTNKKYSIIIDHIRIMM